MIEIKYKQYLIIPRKPKMSPGKLMSQACHATFIALDQEDNKIIEKWKKEGMCVIVLQCKDIIQLMGIDKYFEKWKINHHMYIDEGLTEVDMGTPTALATGILTEDQFWMMSTMKLYK